MAKFLKYFDLVEGWDLLAFDGDDQNNNNDYTSGAKDGSLSSLGAIGAFETNQCWRCELNNWDLKAGDILRLYIIGPTVTTVSSWIAYTDSNSVTTSDGLSTFAPSSTQWLEATITDAFLGQLGDSGGGAKACRWTTLDIMSGLDYAEFGEIEILRQADEFLRPRGRRKARFRNRREDDDKRHVRSRRSAGVAFLDLVLTQSDPGNYANAETSVSIMASASELRRVKPLINRNLSALRRETPEASLEAVIKHLEDIHQFIDFLYARKGQAEETDEYGFPKHGQLCSALDGQHLFLTSDGVDSIVSVAHGLGRRPQGFIKTWGFTEAYVIIPRNDNVDADAASKKVVHFQMTGVQGTTVGGILF